MSESFCSVWYWLTALKLLCFVYAWILEVSILSEISRLRGKVRKRIIKSASLNDVWGMKRYSAINGYLNDVTQNKELKK